MFVTKHAIANVAFNCNCMSTQETAVDFCSIDGRQEGDSCMLQTRHATASVVLDCNCMPTGHPIATGLFVMSEDIGRGAQLHV